MTTPKKRSPTPVPGVTDEIDRRLARAGHRWTKGRRAVVEVMHGIVAPLSVPELQAKVGSSIPLSSLYRILSDLVDAKVLIKLEFAEGFARYEFDEALAHHHHHLVCISCGAVADLELGDLESVLQASGRTIKRRTGFAVDAHRLDFFGTCGKCAAA